MTKFEILDLFVKNGALSEKEILTIYGENDIESCTFQREETFLSRINISEPTRRTPISYAVFCLKKKQFKTT